MKNALLMAALAATTLLASANSARATILYDFEPTDSAGTTDGFAANGLAIITPSTIGATSGVGSLSFDALSAGTFVGALTSTDLPAGLTAASTKTLYLDVTVPTTETFTGGFSDLGLIFNGVSSASGTGFTAQVDFTPDENIDLPAGTSTLAIPLTALDTNSADANFGNDEAISSIFAPGLASLTSFEFFINKSGASTGDADTIFIDAVRTTPTLATTPEPTSIAGLVLGGGALLARRRKA